MSPTISSNEQFEAILQQTVLITSIAFCGAIFCILGVYKSKWYPLLCPKKNGDSVCFEDMASTHSQMALVGGQHDNGTKSYQDIEASNFDESKGSLSLNPIPDNNTEAMSRSDYLNDIEGTAGKEPEEISIDHGAFISHPDATADNIVTSQAGDASDEILESSRESIALRNPVSEAVTDKSTIGECDTVGHDRTDVNPSA